MSLYAELSLKPAAVVGMVGASRAKRKRIKLHVAGVEPAAQRRAPCVFVAAGEVGRRLGVI